MFNCRNSTVSSCVPSTWECLMGLVTAKWKKPLRLMVRVWECSNKSCYHNTYRQHHVLTTPYIVNFNIYIEREESYTKQKYQCNCSDAYFFLCVTNLGDYLVSLSKYSIKGHSPRPFTALSVLELRAYKCPKHYFSYSTKHTAEP